MKKIDIAGIPFTKESLDALHDYLMPRCDVDDPEITRDIKIVDETIFFIMQKWDEMESEVDSEIKHIAIGLSYLKRNLASICVQRKELKD
ncbi:MAG: hypothetical protein LBH90_08080 [Tannerella sp.]|jgi:hypothetical protein|nr:hypothetical protein [Tannerella sp.]